MTTKLPIGGLEDLPGHYIRRLQQIAVGIFMDETADVNVTPVQFALLFAASLQAGLDQRTLAGRIGLDTSTIGAVDDGVRVAEALAEGGARGDAPDQALVEGVVHDHLVGVDRTGAGLLADPQRIERGECVRAELDAGADLAELGRLFEHLHSKAPAHQGKSDGNAADATACNEDGEGRGGCLHGMSCLWILSMYT